MRATMSTAIAAVLAALLALPAWCAEAPVTDRFPGVASAYAVAIDGKLVWASNPDQPRQPASLAKLLAEKGIRVNGVAPGPIWTPLIPATFPPKHVSEFGSDVPMKRPGEPAEVAPCFVFLACDDSSYVTGQVLHPNGGEIING